MGSVFTTIAVSVVDFCSRFRVQGVAHPQSVTVNGTALLLRGVIGEGGYAYVYDSVETRTGGRVAVKRFVLRELEQKEKILAEVEYHRKLSPHDNIVQYYDHEVLSRRGASQPEVWVVMELCPKSLQQEINNRIASKLPMPRDEILKVLSDVVYALCHMHSRSPPVSHWDVKVENILRGVTGKYKLCDFGSCNTVFYQARTGHEVAVTETEIEAATTLLYRAPEAIDVWSKQRIDLRCDIWSLGIVLYVMLHLEMPFSDNPREIIAGVPKRKRGTITDGRKDLEDLLFDKLLVNVPEHRATIFEVSACLAALDPRHTPYQPCAHTEQTPRFE